MTDHRDSFFAMLLLAERDARWEKTHQERYLVGFEHGAKSRFQRIWEGHGLATLRFELRKPEDTTREVEGGAADGSDIEDR